MSPIRSPLAVAGAALLALAASAGSFAQSSSVELPRIGEPADTALSPQEETKIGSRVMAELYSHDYVLEDPEVTDYVTGIVWRLIASAEAEPPPISVAVLGDTRVNAAALPGGFMVVNAGLLTEVRTESELAGVLGHELAHITQRHIARTIEGTQVANIATWAAVLAAILAASADPQVVFAALSLGQAANYQREVNFTRAHELEADRIGIRTMAKAGFDPDAMGSFFVRLEQQSRLYGNQVPEFLQTHPVNTTRISEARMRAAGYARRKVQDPLEFSLMRARARVLTMDRPSEAVEFFAGQGAGNPADQYGLALAYNRLGDNRHALEVLRPTLDAYPQQPNIALLGARILTGQGKSAEGLDRLQKAIEHHPRSAPVILEYAESLIAAGKPDDARQMLLSHEQALGTRMDTYRLLSEAARDSGHTSEAQYQMANYLLQRGDGGGALAALDAALRLTSLTGQERARLRARRAEIAQTAIELPRPQQQQR